MQHQRGLKPRSEWLALSEPLPSQSKDDPSAEHVTAKWLTGAARSERWGDDDPIEIEDDNATRLSLHSGWDDDEEAVTARRSIPHLRAHSASWEPVHPAELIPSVPPPPQASATAPLARAPLAPSPTPSPAVASPVAPSAVAPSPVARPVTAPAGQAAPLARPATPPQVRPAPPLARPATPPQVRRIRPLARPTTPPLARPVTPAASYVPSVGPVAMGVDAEADEEQVDFRPSVLPSARIGVFAGALVAAAALALVVVVGGGLKHAPRASARHAVAAPPPRVEESSIPPPLAVPAPQAEDAKTPPPKETGTIIGSPDHRLYVDGRLTATWKAEVTCGTHVVKNGSAGAARTVDVPCGGEVEVTP
jgi:hypothetical protein